MVDARSLAPSASVTLQSILDADAPLAVDTAWVQQNREQRRQVHSLARQFLQGFGSLVRQIGVHDAMNAAVRAVLDPTMQQMRGLQGGGHATTLVFAGGHTFCDGVWVRATGRAWETAGQIAQTLDRVGARGVSLLPEIDELGMVALARTIRDIGRRPASAPPMSWKDVQIPGVSLLPKEDDEDAHNERARFRRQAFELLDEGLRTTLDQNQLQMDIFVRRRQRSLVLRLVQLAEQSPEDLLTLTTLRDPSLPTTAHTLMVAVLAIALGRGLGLRRRDLLRLGIAALSHNVGQALVPAAVLQAPRELTPEERALVDSHPMLGARHLLAYYGYEPQMAERAIASIEHHRRVDGGGYPDLVDHTSHLFSRIIAVCDVFDAFCQQRPWRPEYPPDQSVKIIGRLGNRQLDLALGRLLIRIVGRYPPGTLVELDTGEYGLVVGPGQGATPLSRPRILLLTDDEGYEIDPFVVVDLGERHARRRAWVRTIMRAREPRGLDRSVSAYLLADRVELPCERLDNQASAPA
jgi:HD-GYP domain-containing protein (c-di-GMP phosphodiesterase class II)